MNLSPILISIRTATAAIVVTFFLGLLAAKLVAGIRGKTGKMILDGILTLPLVLRSFFYCLSLGGGGRWGSSSSTFSALR